MDKIVDNKESKERTQQSKVQDTRLKLKQQQRQAEAFAVKYQSAIKGKDSKEEKLNQDKISRMLTDKKKSEESPDLMKKVMNVLTKKGKEEDKDTKQLGKNIQVKEDKKSEDKNLKVKDHTSQVEDREEGESRVVLKQQVRHQEGESQDKSKSQDSNKGGKGGSSEGEGQSKQGGSDSSSQFSSFSQSSNSGKGSSFNLSGGKNKSDRVNKIGGESGFSRNLSKDPGTSEEFVSEKLIDSIVKNVNLIVKDNECQEMEIEFSDTFHDGLKFKVARSLKGLILTFFCPDKDSRRTFLMNRLKILNHLNDRKVVVSKIEIM